MVSFYKGCSSDLHQFEKYQDLPTKGAADVEHFAIDGSLFLAFANFRDDSDGFSTKSFIYKLNDSTAKFSLYQTIDTIGAYVFEYFTVADKHYLAVANFKSEKGKWNLESVIYQWNGQQFDVLQNISTNGATKQRKMRKNCFLPLRIIVMAIRSVSSQSSTNGVAGSLKSFRR